MNNHTQTRIDRESDTGYETSKFAMTVGIIASALIGIWALACMSNVILQNGIGTTLRGLFGVILGN